jgi:murein DD-endopeptidase MepM/ murein hydrolase activator NlpD
MLFGDHAEWWANGYRRRTIHEVIDFAEGLAPDGKIKSIPEGAPVRAMADGEIVSVLDDFLGKTVVVRHSSLTHENGEIFHTLYSHIQIAAESVGSISKGGLLGRVGRSINTRTPAHLHLTGSWIPKSIRSSEISMEYINPGFAPVILVSFNDHLNI